jgi:hypothetical protein
MGRKYNPICLKHNEPRKKAQMCRVCKAEWAKANYSAGTGCGKRYRENNLEKVKAYLHDYYLANKESWKESSAKWKADNREKVNEYSRASYARRKEKHNACVKAWNQRNPEKSRLYVNRRNAIKAAAPGILTKEDWLGICKAQDYKCLDCGRDDVPMTIGHLTPLFKGGTNWPENIAAQCKPCNSKQGTKIHKAVAITLESA